MTAKDDANAQAKVLLERALADPFGLAPAKEPWTHILEWFRFLGDRFPLWSFQPHAFSNLYPLGRTSNHPLPLIVESILRDDGISTDGQLLDPLPAEIDRRRYALCKDLLHTPDAPSLEGGYSQFLPRVTTELAFTDPDTGDDVSPYDNIGRDLVELVDARERTAPKSPERKQAKDALADFLNWIGAAWSKGRHPDVAPTNVLKALLREGVGILKLYRNARSVDISGNTRTLLEPYGISSEEDVYVWVAQAALPVLSRPEILTIRAQYDKANHGGRAGSRPTPLRVSVWILSHRLMMDPVSLARRTRGETVSEYFNNKSNPIEAFLS